MELGGRGSSRWCYFDVLELEMYKGVAVVNVEVRLHSGDYKTSPTDRQEFFEYQLSTTDRQEIFDLPNFAYGPTEDSSEKLHR